MWSKRWFPWQSRWIFCIATKLVFTIEMLLLGNNRYLVIVVGVLMHLRSCLRRCYQKHVLKKVVCVETHLEEVGWLKQWVVEVTVAVTLDICCFNCKLWWLWPLGETCVGYIVLNDGPGLNHMVSFKYIYFLLKLLFVTNEISTFSKMLGSHENLCEISLNISLERIIFVNIYICKLLLKRERTVARSVNCHHPLPLPTKYGI